MIPAIEERVVLLERKVARLRAVGIAACFVAAACLGLGYAQWDKNALRGEFLTITDDEGRDRIILGASEGAFIRMYGECGEELELTCETGSSRMLMSTPSDGGSATTMRIGTSQPVAYLEANSPKRGSTFTLNAGDSDSELFLWGSNGSPHVRLHASAKGAVVQVCDDESRAGPGGCARIATDKHGPSIEVRSVSDSILFARPQPAIR